MTNKTRTYNTGKAITRKELNDLIKNAQVDGDWSKVEQANVSKITDISSLFEDVKGIENLNLDGWDTSNVKYMNSMFLKSDYNHPLHFDTSNVTNMSFVFYGSKYNHPLDFDTSKVTDMGYMFYCSDYNHPLNFDTSKVKYMYFMFNNSKYNHPLDFDTSNVIDMKDIFDNSLITHPITFNGGNIPDDVQAFIDEANTAYEEKCKLDNLVHECHDSNVITSSFKI